MKKLFIAAMALATIVSCSKDDADTVLTSKQKSVTVTIQNSKIGATRATVTGDQLNPIAVSGAAGTTVQVDQLETLVANLSDLKILFANSAGVVVKKMNLVNTPDNNVHTGNNATNPLDQNYIPGAIENQTYTFHRVPETVVTIAVIRDTKDLVYSKITEGTTKLTDVQKSALDATQNLPVGVQDIFLYAEKDLKKNENGECYTDTDSSTGVETTYYYYDATLDIKPQFARFELVSVGCEDLGAENADGDNDYGFDELVIDDFTMPVGNVNYTYDWVDNNHLYGSYCATENATGDHPKTPIYSINPGTVKVTVDDKEVEKPLAWSWNIPAATELDFSVETGNPMVLNLTASAHDYIVNNSAKKLRVVALTDSQGAPVTSFDKGFVYRLALNFKEENIDKTDDQLCVRATITIDKWSVVVVDADFATGSND